MPPPDEWGRTPLHVAVKHGQVEIVKLLLHNGANVNAKDAAGLTPLLLVGYNNQDQEVFESVIHLLVESGADVNVKNNITGSEKTNITASILALLKRNLLGTTALLHAVALKSLKATEMLLDAGAWISENFSKETELHEAASKGLRDILEIFLNDSRMTMQVINKVDERGRSALYR